MAVSVYKTARRWRIVDELMELGLGAAALLGVLSLGTAAAAAAVSLISAVFGNPSAGLGVFAFLVPLLALKRLDALIRQWVLKPWINRGTVRIGDDGVHLSGVLLDRFVGYAEIEQIVNHRGRRRLILELRGGRRVSFRVAERVAVFEELTRRRAEHEAREAGPRVAALERPRSDLAAWIARARALASGGYRDEVHSPDALARVVEDASAEPEQRLGAAIALAEAPEGVRIRVRVAAEETARPGLGEALTRAASGEVEPSVVRRALR